MVLFNVRFNVRHDWVWYGMFVQWVDVTRHGMFRRLCSAAPKRRGKTIRHRNVAPQGEENGSDWWNIWLTGEIMYNDVPSHFYSSPATGGVGDPYKVAFRVFRVAKEPTGFAAGGEFGRRTR